MIDRFNIRVYGLLVLDGKVLLSKEQYQGRQLMKFPGGGLEYGEGIREALIRECLEELNSQVEVGDLFYVTDYFIQSDFIPSDQIICFYYLIHTEEEINFSNAEHRLDWVELNPDNGTLLTFPQDTLVFERICAMASE